LARNLGIPLSGHAGSIDVALGARARRIDVGHLHLESPDGGSSDHVFLVGSGIGFDAVLMENTDPELKKRAGALAYVAAGLKLGNLRRLLTTVSVDDQTPVNLHTRSLIIGNCGYLQGGIALLPDAKPDDGLLDVAAIGTRSGLGGWLEVGGAMLLQNMGRRVRKLQRSGGPITHLSGQSIHVHAERAEAVQVDGDPVGHARVLVASIAQRALLVKAPSGA
jgi:diacylglycerol kinase family enzyme